MAKAQSSTPSSFFNFLKEGVLLPARNRRLFVAVFLLVVASTTLLLFISKNVVLSILPTVTDNKFVKLHTRALNGTDNPIRSSESLQDDTSWNLMLVIRAAGYYLFTVVVSSIIQITVIFAAVTTYSGELHTFAELLSKVKKQLKGPLLTRAFVYALEIVTYVGLVAAQSVLLAALMFVLLFFLTPEHYTTVIYVAACVLFTASFFLHYCFSFLCSFSVVVAVADPAGCHGAGAVRCAWHLMKGKKTRALLFISVTAVLATVVTPAAHMLAAKTSNAASELLLDAILKAAIELFTVCAMTAFYYECKRSIDASAGGYIL